MLTGHPGTLVGEDDGASEVANGIANAPLPFLERLRRLSAPGCPPFCSFEILVFCRASNYARPWNLRRRTPLHEVCA